LVFYICFNRFFWKIFYFLFVSILRDIFCNVLHLLIVCVHFGNRLILGCINSLVFSDGFCHSHIFCNLLRNILSYLSFNWNLDLYSYGLIINIRSLNRNMLDIRHILGSFCWIDKGSLILWLKYWLLILILVLNWLLSIRHILLNISLCFDRFLNIIYRLTLSICNITVS
jgi:hypothetical protein